MHVSDWVVKGALPPIIRLAFPRFADEFSQEASRFYTEIERLEEKVKALEAELKAEREKRQAEIKAWEQRHADMHTYCERLKRALKAALEA